MNNQGKRKSVSGDVETLNKGKLVQTPNKAKLAQTPNKIKQTPNKVKQTPNKVKQTPNLSEVRNSAVKSNKKPNFATPKSEAKVIKNDGKRSHEENLKLTPKRLKTNSGEDAKTQVGSPKEARLGKIRISFPTNVSPQQFKKTLQKLVNDSVEVEGLKFMEVGLNPNKKENQESLEIIKNIEVSNKNVMLYGMKTADCSKRSVFVYGLKITSEDLKAKYNAVSVKKHKHMKNNGAVFVLTFTSEEEAEKAAKKSVEIRGVKMQPLIRNYSVAFQRTTPKALQQKQQKLDSQLKDSQKSKETQDRKKKPVVVVEEEVEDDDDSSQEEEEEEDDVEEEIEEHEEEMEEEDDDDDDDDDDEEDEDEDEDMEE